MACTFSAARMERLREIETTHFWFVARRALIRHLVVHHVPASATIVDVGCGTGTNLRAVLRHGTAAVGVDGRVEGLRPDARVAYAQGDLERLPLMDGCADAVLALDVLEHVDDAAALEQVRRVLRPGGTLVVTVPAFSFLWSYRDDDAGHLRRYTARQLRRVLEDGGFEVLWSSFYSFVGFPLLLVTRTLGRNRPVLRDAEDRPPGFANAVMTRLSLAEVGALRRGRTLPWGSSLAVVARRPPDGS